MLSPVHLRKGNEEGEGEEPVSKILEQFSLFCSSLFAEAKCQTISEARSIFSRSSSSSFRSRDRGRRTRLRRGKMEKELHVCRLSERERRATTSEQGQLFVLFASHIGNDVLTMDGRERKSLAFVQLFVVLVVQNELFCRD